MNTRQARRLAVCHYPGGGNRDSTPHSFMGLNMSKKDLGIPGHPVGEFVEEFCTKPVYDEDGIQSSASIGRDGKEYGDPTPLEPPAGVNAPPDLMTMIKTMVHHEAFTRAMDEEGWDTFEEAGDYDLPEDGPDPLTPHEALFHPPAEAPPLAKTVIAPAEAGGSPEPPPAPAAPSLASTST